MKSYLLAATGASLLLLAAWLGLGGSTSELRRTTVLTPIEEIAVGDQVVCQNVETGETDVRRVERTFSRPSVSLYRVEIETDGVRAVYETTAEHPFYVAGRGYVDAGDLRPGDELFDENGYRSRFVGAASSTPAEPKNVYNFAVADRHNYFVAAPGSTETLLVHNLEDCGEILPRRFRGGKHGDTKGPVGDGLDSNHSPADAITRFQRDDGPAFQMEPADHRLMSSTGGSTIAKEWRQKQKELIAQGKLREAVQMDVDEARRLFGSKYDEAIQEMMDYIDSIGY